MFNRLINTKKNHIKRLIAEGKSNQQIVDLLRNTSHSCNTNYVDEVRKS